MNSEIVLVILRRTDSIMDEVAELYDRITKRAYDEFLQRGGGCVLPIDDYLVAEQALVRKPRVKLIPETDTFTAALETSELELQCAELLITPTQLLFKARTPQEPSEIFRTIHLPREIDPQSVNTKRLQGNIIVTGRFAAVH
jgi:hypothetical protein